MERALEGMEKSIVGNESERKARKRATKEWKLRGRHGKEQRRNGKREEGTEKSNEGMEIERKAWKRALKE